jgi:hypothetical protein
MKQISQMKEIIIATVAVATLISCQSEKDKLIDGKISSIDTRLESINYNLEDWDRYYELMKRKSTKIRHVSSYSGDTLYERPEYTEEEREFMYTLEAKLHRSSELKSEKEYWILQK